WRNARTGLETPPGNRSSAWRKSFSDFSIEPDEVVSGMIGILGSEFGQDVIDRAHVQGGGELDPHDVPTLGRGHSQPAVAVIDIGAKGRGAAAFEGAQKAAFPLDARAGVPVIEHAEQALRLAVGGATFDGDRTLPRRRQPDLWIEPKG